MNLQFLGDTFDHWKGSLFGDLARAQLLRDFAVDPMATDAGRWTAADLQLYARLLRVHPEQVIPHDSSLVDDRHSYFAEIGHNGDLFLDPDTGIAPRRPIPPWQYVHHDDLHRLLTSRHRVVAVYQHISRTKTRQRLQILMMALSDSGHPFVCCSYESPSAAMLFFSRDQDRVFAIREYFEDLLGNHSSRRIGFWQHSGHP